MQEGSVTVSLRLDRNISAEFSAEELPDNFRTLLVHFVDTGAAIDLNDLVQLFVVLDDRHGGLLVNAFEGRESFEPMRSGRSHSRNRFLMVSSLSSPLPLVSPRFRSRFNMTSSVVV